MKRNALWIVGLVSLIVGTMPLAAALTTAPAANGYTHVTNTSCMAQLEVPHNQSVTLGSNPDTLRVPMNIYWFDERNANPPEIRHWFHMDTTYNSVHHQANHNETTTGGMGSQSSGNFHMDVPIVWKDTNMWVHYSVTVSYTSNGTTLCFGDNSGEWPPVTFYLV